MGGIILFIVSEVLFFFSFFWAFFHRSLAPAVDIGASWPPAGIQPFNPFQIPLLNTAILLASGVTVTWAHHGLMENNFTQTTQGLALTILLGIYFTSLQALEYYEAPFCMQMQSTVQLSTWLQASMGSTSLWVQFSWRQ